MTTAALEFGLLGVVAAGLSAVLMQVPDVLMKALALVGDAARVAGAPSLFNSEVYGKLLGSAWYSSARITRELRFQAEVPLEVGLPDFVAWYRSLCR